MTLCPYCKEEGVKPRWDPEKRASIGFASIGRTGTGKGLLGRTIWGPESLYCPEHGDHPLAEVEARFGKDWRSDCEFEVCWMCGLVYKTGQQHWHNVTDDRFRKVEERLAALEARVEHL